MSNATSVAVAEPTTGSHVAVGRRTFHRLRVTDVDHLCDDAAAVTFEVPPELAEDFAFQPGQSVTVRRMIDGQEERRDYSICAPVGARLRIGVREVPDGLRSEEHTSELQSRGHIV